MGLEEDNLILGVVEHKSNSEDEMQLIRWRLQDMSSFGHRAGLASECSQRYAMSHEIVTRASCNPEGGSKNRDLDIEEDLVVDAVDARVAPFGLERGPGLSDAPESIAPTNLGVIADELALSTSVVEDRPTVE
ncbi:hypothetical protein JCGZ_10970 [Jatropha curcas]|uniref:Uncharacterized protein n=1 Tax=Jatropha curcas TaxID=180498 RepID=A0A067LDV0_JATCU|nr:hypothetical protein JCGZ_10970 [Jatropha curcas]